MVVLDTCALIEFCKDKCEISSKVINQIDEGAFILSISFAEIACKIKLKKLILNVEVSELYHYVTQTKAIEIVNIGFEEWINSINLDWPTNKDPADRLVTAFAKKHHLPIVTSDAQIKKFYKKTLW